MQRSLGHRPSCRLPAAGRMSGRALTRSWRWTMVVVAVAIAAYAVPVAADAAAAGVWRPRPGTTWQWQLTTPVAMSVNARVFDIDLFENSARVVRALHARGHRVVCY